MTKKEKIPPVPTALYGAFAGLVSASATFPVEVVRYSDASIVLHVSRLCQHSFYHTKSDVAVSLRIT